MVWHILEDICLVNPALAIASERAQLLLSTITHQFSSKAAVTEAAPEVEFDQTVILTVEPGNDQL